MQILRHVLALRYTITLHEVNEMSQKVIRKRVRRRLAQQEADEGDLDVISGVSEQ